MSADGRQGLRGHAWRDLVANEHVAGRLGAGVLALAAAAMLALLVFVGRWLTFWYDEWNFVLDRTEPSIEGLLISHNGHLVAVPVLIYQALIHTFGLESYYPFLAVDWALHFSSVALLYVIVRRRAGPIVGLGAGLSLLFLGSAFENLLQPFQLSFLLSTTFGLLAIERMTTSPGSSRRYALAAVALLVAIASSSVGMLFVGLVGLWAILDRDPKGVAACLPAFVVFAGWYLIFAGTGDGSLPASAAQLAAAPAKLVYGLGAAVAAVVGLQPERFAWLGAGLGAGIVAVAAVAVSRGVRITSLAIASVAALMAEYALQAVLRASLGVEHASRSAYLYPAAIFLWIAAAEFLARYRGTIARRPWVVAGLATLLALAVAGNMVQFVGASRASRMLRQTEIAQLRVIEALRGSPSLDRHASPDPQLMPQVRAGAYLDTIARFGVPHLAIAEPTLTDPEPVDPVVMDATLLRLVGGALDDVASSVRLSVPNDIRVEAASAVATSECVRVTADHTTGTATWLPRGDEVRIRATSADAIAAVRLGAFGTPSDLNAGASRREGGLEVAIALPDVPNPHRWTVAVSVRPGHSVEVCDATAR